MRVVLFDDHSLRDWIAGPDPALVRAIRNAEIATTNLWYARLCKSAASSTLGSMLKSWSSDEREILIASLIALPETIRIVPMQQLAWRMGQVTHEYHGLSMLGAEAVSAAQHLGASLLVSSRDDGPGIRNACHALTIRYVTLNR